MTPQASHHNFIKLTQSKLDELETFCLSPADKGGAGIAPITIIAKSTGLLQFDFLGYQFIIKPEIAPVINYGYVRLYKIVDGDIVGERKMVPVNSMELVLDGFGNTRFVDKKIRKSLVPFIDVEQNMTVITNLGQQYFRELLYHLNEQETAYFIQRGLKDLS
jgi:hypothetical protein